jgi:hypothetical protein
MLLCGPGSEAGRNAPVLRIDGEPRQPGLIRTAGYSPFDIMDYRVGLFAPHGAGDRADLAGRILEAPYAPAA